MTSSNLTKRIMTSLTLIFLVLIMFNINYFLVFSLLIIGTLSIIEFCSITKKIFTNKVYILFSNFFFISYIFLFCILFFSFFKSHHIKNNFVYASTWLCCFRYRRLHNWKSYKRAQAYKNQPKQNYFWCNRIINFYKFINFKFILFLHK